MIAAFYQSPIGWIEINGTTEAITVVRFVEQVPVEREKTCLPPVIEQCISELNEYFSGNRLSFTVPLSAQGTAFQQQVWEQLCSIPFGETVSYRELARLLDRAQAVRAVGHANGRNQLGILVPCHRVIGSNGSLTGYAWGIWRKEWLLAHERAVLQGADITSLSASSHGVKPATAELPVLGNG